MEVDGESRDIQQLLEGFMESDVGFGIEDMLDGGEMWDGKEFEEFDWSMPMISLPLWEPSGEVVSNGEEVAVFKGRAEEGGKSSSVDQEQVPVLSDKSSASSDLPMHDSASSTCNAGAPPRTFVIPAKDFVFQPSVSHAQGDSGVQGNHETITTGVPELSSLHSNMENCKSPMLYGGVGMVFPPPCTIPPGMDVPQISGGGSPKPCSSDKLESGVKRQRPADEGWKLIEDPEERKRQKRMAKNRHTAAMSRARRRQYLHDLENRVKNLEQENASLRYWLGAAQHENLALKAAQQYPTHIPHRQPNQLPPIAIRSQGENQEPAVLQISALLAILQLVVSPMILPMVGLLLVMMMVNADGLGDQEAGFPQKTNSSMAIALVLLSLLWLSASLAPQQDDMDMGKKIDVIKTLIPWPADRLGVKAGGEVTSVGTETKCSVNLDKLSHSGVD